MAVTPIYFTAGMILLDTVTQTTDTQRTQGFFLSDNDLEKLPIE
jgi:hypothetical protein